MMLFLPTLAQRFVLHFAAFTTEVFNDATSATTFHRLLLVATLLPLFSNLAFADDSTRKVREGMRLYAAEQFEEASKSFAAATVSFEKAKSEKATITAFDEACALHRKGDLELARERYLKAGLSQDNAIATSAHFNIGVIGSEQARKLSGDNPEKATEEQRKEILGELRRSIDSYRHCLEIQPKHAQARHNLELLRQWIKYYSDRWRELDLQKRRDETNLIQFLDYLIQTQLELKKTADGFGSNTSPNLFAELKRVQDELGDEIPFLRDKIESELRPPEEDPKNAGSVTNSAVNKEELERGIELLSGWADEAGLKMAAAGKDLIKREAKLAADKQKSAANKLDQIWDAVVPFHPLLGRELADQTQIAKQLVPKSEGVNTEEAAQETPVPGSEPNSFVQDTKLKVSDDDFAHLLEQQEKGLRKARLLGPKAESELAQVESQPNPEKTDESSQSADRELSNAQPKIDPEAIKAGYQKAIELAPSAIKEMESVVQQLTKRELSQAAKHAEEARRILQEIQDAQPKNPQQEPKDDNKDQNKDPKEDGEQKQDQDKDKKEGDGKDPNNEQKKPEEKKEESKDKENKDKNGEQRQEPKVSQDRIEEALRRVREREQEKRERDRELKARVLGRVPVDKDW